MQRRPAGTKPKTAHHRSSERERHRHYQRAQSQEHHVTDHNYGEERYTQHNTDYPWAHMQSSHHGPLGGKGQRWVHFRETELERIRDIPSA